MSKITTEVILIPAVSSRIMRLCGTANEHIDLIESHLDVQIYINGAVVRFHGEPSQIQKASELMLKLYKITAENNMRPQDIQTQINQFQIPNTRVSEQSTHTNRRPQPTAFKGMTPAQQKYIENIEKHTINFAMGPAGSGKTYVAVNYAMMALQEGDFEKVIIVRPAVEAGENLGFLPGQISEKIDPYLRPIYDIMDETPLKKQIPALIKSEKIQTIPLAYMRGQTLKNAFVILDEAQNTTPGQMKMFLTRLGAGTKMVITGDVTQTDLNPDESSGLLDAIRRLSGAPGIVINQLTASDIVRHPLVRMILERYDSK